MAQASVANARQKLDEEVEAGAARAEGPLLPPILVRFSVVGGILAVMAVGAILLVTDVIAPRLKRLGEPAPAAVEGANAVEVREPSEVFEIKDLIVNPAGSGGRRYLKVTAAIELEAERGRSREKKAPAARGAAAGSLQNAQIRDLLIRELSSRTPDELTDPVTKEEIRQGILDGLSEVFGTRRVANVYFTDYVVQ